MALKRQLREGGDGDGDSQLGNKRRHLLSTLFSRFRNPEEFVPMLEPILRKWVKEEVGRAIDPYLRSLDAQSERNLHLKFESSLPTTLFTGNRISTKIALYDPSCQSIVASGPHSSIKVAVVALHGDFAADDEWSPEEFEAKIVQSRQGKRPLLNGDSVVALKNGVANIDHICFTDNSSWGRSGKFRLGVRLPPGSHEPCVREGVSNAFKVKDQRGESYQKHHPPSLDDEVWRLEKIAKGGAYHTHLTKLGIANVGDFLRSLALNPISLRTAIGNVSSKKWEAVGHAAECILDDNKYVYTSGQGAVLLFNSIYSLVGVAFDGLSYLSVDALDAYQTKMAEELKQQAFENLNGLVPQTMGQNTHHAALENISFELGESSAAGFYMAEDFEVESYHLLISLSQSILRLV
ncbi:calmodulin-binding protein 60 B-like isoform X2 [Salvia miltiorrhiza]|uniref:calmodulin-binding protein 60 B-like isoform X2 n=1 Tax=Salvia miltiorrhiza TaxID=226208 RepID=UPI0025ACE493|nr:calmodulin-binding protein 60 B-like isoform X2 [Salvia miltiorrhiza]